MARAYVDSLARGNGIPNERQSAIRSALDPAVSNARAAAGSLDELAGQLDRDRASKSPRDAARIQSLSATLRGTASKMR